MEAKSVLLPVHGDTFNNTPLWLACNLTKATKGKIYVIYVIEVSRELPIDADIPFEIQKSEDMLRRIEGLGKKYRGNIEASILQARDAGPAVVQEASERNVDAIVIGLNYKRRFGIFDLGKTAPYVLKNASCPVFLLRARRETNVSSLVP
jgi:nucleotide-binding universal stress UspA family protein